MKEYHLKEPIKKYLHSLQYEKKLSKNTVNSYEENLYLFQEFLKQKDLFQVTKDDVSLIIQKQFEEYYQKEVEEGYLIAEECNYQCFLNWRGVSDYMDDVHYYVRDGSLIAYRGFSIYSVFSEEEFFDDESYEFKISN